MNIFDHYNEYIEESFDSEYDLAALSHSLITLFIYTSNNLIYIPYFS